MQLLVSIYQYISSVFVYLVLHEAGQVAGLTPRSCTHVQDTLPGPRTQNVAHHHRGKVLEGLDSTETGH